MGDGMTIMSTDHTDSLHNLQGLRKLEPSSHKEHELVNDIFQL